MTIGDRGYRRNELAAGAEPVALKDAIRKGFEKRTPTRSGLVDAIADEVSALYAAPPPQLRELDLLKRCREFLEYLDRKGGLGYKIHDEIRSILAALAGEQKEQG